MKTIKLQECSWRDVETYLQSDDRIIIPVGSTEQQSHLSRAVLHAAYHGGRLATYALAHLALLAGLAALTAD